MEVTNGQSYEVSGNFYGTFELKELVSCIFVLGSGRIGTHLNVELFGNGYLGVVSDFDRGGILHRSHRPASYGLTLGE